jgi:ABC-type Mn2+/Zn2+ transport system permease subunit
MKLMLAKLIHLMGIVLAIGMALGIVGLILWAALMMIPIMGYIFLGFAGLIGFGFLFGWAEKELEQADYPRKVK